jgi:hypothetical protein
MFTQIVRAVLKIANAIRGGHCGGGGSGHCS